MAQLSEDDIDDVLYLARTNAVADLKEQLHELRTAPHPPASDAALLAAAVDAASGNTAAHYAAANGHVEILALIHDAEAADAPPPPASLLVQPNGQGNTPLHWAALNGQLATVKLLVGYGADASAPNQAGHDAVFEAEKAEREEVVTWLLTEARGLEQGIAGGEEAEGEAEPDGQSAAEERGSSATNGDSMAGVETTDRG